MPKRCHRGIYRYMSQQHLDRQVNEFAGLRNERPCGTLRRIGETVQYMVGKRLTCVALIG